MQSCCGRQSRQPDSPCRVSCRRRSGQYWNRWSLAGHTIVLLFTIGPGALKLCTSVSRRGVRIVRAPRTPRPEQVQAPTPTTQRQKSRPWRRPTGSHRLRERGLEPPKPLIPTTTPPHPPVTRAPNPHDSGCPGLAPPSNIRDAGRRSRRVEVRVEERRGRVRGPGGRPRRGSLIVEEDL